MKEIDAYVLVSILFTNGVKDAEKAAAVILRECRVYRRKP